jgi:hypothetical protein
MMRYQAAADLRSDLNRVKRETKGGRREHARFLELWRNADPGLPEVAEAREKTAGRRAS